MLKSFNEFIIQLLFNINCNIFFRQGLEPNPNVFGPLRNLPDYSFVDGRPVPLGFKKSEALQLQKKYYVRN